MLQVSDWIVIQQYYFLSQCLSDTYLWYFSNAQNTIL